MHLLSSLRYMSITGIFLIWLVWGFLERVTIYWLNYEVFPLLNTYLSTYLPMSVCLYVRIYLFTYLSICIHPSIHLLRFSAVSGRSRIKVVHSGFKASQFWFQIYRMHEQFLVSFLVQEIFDMAGKAKTHLETIPLLCCIWGACNKGVLFKIFRYLSIGDLSIRYLCIENLAILCTGNLGIIMVVAYNTQVTNTYEYLKISMHKCQTLKCPIPEYPN